MDQNYRLRPDEHLLILILTIAISAAVLIGVGAMNRAIPAAGNGPEEKTVGITVTVPEKARPATRDSGIAGNSRAAAAPVPAPPTAGSTPSNISLALPGTEALQPSFDAGELLGSTGSIILTEDSVDRKPEVLSGGMVYPEMARQRGIEGRVLVSVLINTDGSAETVEVLESDPPGVFDNAVLQAVGAWQFSPARYNDQTVRVWARFPVTFELD